MAKRPAFVLSSDVSLELGADTVSLKHAGDVVLEQSLGRRLEHVEAGGDLTIRLPKITGTLVAGGKLTLIGDVDAVSIRAREVVLGDQTITCRAVSASRSITIGAAKLQCDVIIAPTVSVDPAASGRVTVMQSGNERPPTKIKGGFSLADYEDMFGDAAGFLRERGLDPDTAHSAQPDDEPTIADEEDDAAADDEVVQLTPAIAPPAQVDEEVDDPLSLSLDDLEPIREAANGDANVQAQLRDALERITSCYRDGDVPPAVSELRELIQEGDLETLSTNITAVWNGLLGFHQKRGIRPHHQVTHAFNVIHSLVG